MKACDSACEDLRTIGFIAPSGKYSGIYSVLDLDPGDYLPRGYLVQAEAVADMSDADRSSRKAPPIYVTILEAGAVHSVTIAVNVVQ
jgi:hypothetical protein